MCGIAGVFNRDGAPVDQRVLRRMGAAVAHRGPDGEGHYTDAEIGLAHRRLAVIDPSPAGEQPMHSADGRYVLVYNGTVYNFRELRAELASRGHAFRSQSDSEVVLQGFAEWGAGVLDRLNGMFALAVWDRRERSLFLARDRYGTKPLYWAERGPLLLFGSEVKALLAHPALHAAMDPEALLEYFTFQNFFTDRTLFKGVRMLPAGHWVHAGAAGFEGPVQFWDFDFAEPERAADERAYVEELDRLFRQAVARQLVADVDLGAYLSGGVDSGAVCAAASTYVPYMKTFTAGFDLRSASGLEQAFDERGRAAAMSHRFRTEHYEAVLKAGDMERVLPRLVRHVEEPRIGQSYPNFYIARLASRFVKVALSGAGGDELFAGYPWRYYRAAVNDGFEDYADKYYLFWQRLIEEHSLQDAFRPVWPEVSHVSPRDIFRAVFRQGRLPPDRPEDYINHSLYFEAKTFLHGLLVVEDKIGMAHGLETRVPFLDNDLVDFAARVPVGLKLGNLREVVRLNENEAGHKVEKYYNHTRDGKLLLRKMVGRYVPADIAGGAKQGFAAPDASWFKGESMAYVRERLYDDRAAIYDFLDPQVIRALVDEHLQGRRNRRLLIWSLLSVEQFCREFLGGR